MSKLSTKNLVGFSIFATLLLFAFSGSHPTTGTGGYTGAPNDSACTVCHSPGGSIDGNIVIDGLPATIQPNTTYPLSITITRTAGSATRAGFQMVSLKTNLSNGGTFSVPATENNAQVKTAAGKSYIGHQPAKTFSGNTVEYDVDWTSPSDQTGDITVYAASIIANGGSGNSGDKFVVTNQSVTIDGGGGGSLAGTFSNIVDASCSDSADGSATINATGGSGNYMYNWDNGESTATAVMLTGGDHMVTVTDDSNGEIVETVTIGAPDPLVPTIINLSDADCNGSDSGSAELVTTGGTGGFNYNWGNGITGAVQNSLFAGLYNVTVSDANNCTTTIDVTIAEPDAIQINIITLEEPSCNGDDDGLIAVEATGGVGNFTYNWLDGIGIPSDGVLSSIPAGDYQIEVIDGNDCTTQTNITLGEPTEVTSTITGTSVLCFGDSTGSATAEGSGGNGGFTYSWSNGGTGATIDGLPAGVYIVTISDSENCTIESEYEVTQPATPVEAGISVESQPNCGNSDGELSAFALGGTPDYTYLWNDDTTNPVLTNISSGEYTVTVTDANNCTDSFTINLTDNDGVTLAANDVVNNECNGDANGSATISASGGTGDYTFAWSNGGTNATETNLPAGEYTITVTDEGNCTGEITIEVTEPDAFSTNESVTNISCNGADNGSINLNVSGGTGGYSYLWNTGSMGEVIEDLIPGIFSVTITDENNCSEEFEFVITEPEAIELENVETITPSCPDEMDGSISVTPTGGTGGFLYLWNTGATTSVLSNIEAGDYSVSVTDQTGCEAVFEFTLDNPLVLSISSDTTTPTCNDSEDGSATLTLIGGTGMYSILWSTGDSTVTAENLSGGSYGVTVTDSNGCSEEVIVVIDAPPAIQANVSSTNETSNGANDGTATCDPADGVAPYTFSWSNGETTQTIENLAPGTYDVTITDANGCTITASTIVNNGDCALTSNTEIFDITCFGEEDGSITVSLIGAVDPVEYEWNIDANTASVSGLAAGTYSVTATDANNCQIQILDIEILEPEEIVSTDPIIVDASGSSSADGSIEIDFSGGTGALDIFYYLIDGIPMAVDDFDDLLPGEYFADVTDENNCVKTFGPFTVGVISSTTNFVALDVNVYPNPAKSFFVVETDATFTSRPVIYSVSGQVIQLDVQQNGTSYRFDTNQLNNGVYYIKLITNKGAAMKKIFVAK